jgi:dUTP pyrophosphatase
MKVKVKKLGDKAVISSYAKEGDAGLDLIATSYSIDETGNHTYGTELAIEIPIGYVGLLFPRSSVSKYSLQLANSVGVIDSGYRGEIIVKFKPSTSITYSRNKIYQIGEKVAQLVILPYPSIELVEVSNLNITDRGENGFGSTGNVITNITTPLTNFEINENGEINFNFNSMANF